MHIVSRKPREEVPLTNAGLPTWGPSPFSGNTWSHWKRQQMRNLADLYSGPEAQWNTSEEYMKELSSLRKTLLRGSDMQNQTICRQTCQSLGTSKIWPHSNLKSRSSQSQTKSALPQHTLCVLGRHQGSITGYSWLCNWVPGAFFVMTGTSWSLEAEKRGMGRYYLTFKTFSDISFLKRGLYC